jgi:hypothetical protein
MAVVEDIAADRPRPSPIREGRRWTALELAGSADAGDLSASAIFGLEPLEFLAGARTAALNFGIGSRNLLDEVHAGSGVADGERRSPTRSSLPVASTSERRGGEAPGSSRCSLSASLISPDKLRSFAAAARSSSARTAGGTRHAMNLLSLINDIYTSITRRCPWLMPKMRPKLA